MDGIEARPYVGTYMAWESTTADGGRREIRFYMDGDKEFPTICRTGTEDYFVDPTI